jgi:hypothetical protein
MILGTFDCVVGGAWNVGFGVVEHVGFGTWIMNITYSERKDEN